MSIPIEGITFAPGELKCQTPASATDVANKDYVDTTSSSFFQVGVYSNSTAGSLSNGTWATLNFSLTPDFEINNPLVSSTATTFVVPAGKYNLVYEGSFHDSGAFNNNTRASVRVLDGGSVIPRGTSSAYIFGGFEGTSYQIQRSIFAEFAVQSTLSIQIRVNDVNWSYTSGSMAFSIRKIGS
jgi:hypothetical protein